MNKEKIERIKEFKKNYGKYFDKIGLIDVVSWLEYNFEKIENEWEGSLKSSLEIQVKSHKDEIEQLKKEYNDYWAHYLVWKLNQNEEKLLKELKR